MKTLFESIGQIFARYLVISIVLFAIGLYTFTLTAFGAADSPESATNNLSFVIPIVLMGTSFILGFIGSIQFYKKLHAMNYPGLAPLLLSMVTIFLFLPLVAISSWAVIVILFILLQLVAIK